MNWIVYVRFDSGGETYASIRADSAEDARYIAIESWDLQAWINQASEHAFYPDNPRSYEVTHIEQEVFS